MKNGAKFSSSNRVLRLNTSQCRREYKSGAVYHGELEGIKKSGRGTFKWPNGACYDGEYVDNTRHGYGKQCWPDGSIYEGTLMRDMRHGVGTLNWSDGEVCFRIKNLKQSQISPIIFSQCQFRIDSFKCGNESIVLNYFEIEPSYRFILLPCITLNKKYSFFL